MSRQTGEVIPSWRISVKPGQPQQSHIWYAMTVQRSKHGPPEYKPPYVFSVRPLTAAPVTVCEQTASSEVFVHGLVIKYLHSGCFPNRRLLLVYAWRTVSIANRPTLPQSALTDHLSSKTTDSRPAWSDATNSLLFCLRAGLIHRCCLCFMQAPTDGTARSCNTFSPASLNI
jgi:hypothetical protein